MVPITQTPEWRALVQHRAGLEGRSLRQLFEEDPGRGERMTVELDDLVLDYSKHRVTDETIELLVAVAERAGLAERIEAMFAGRHVNPTEDRAALHVALRAHPDDEFAVDGHDVVAMVVAERRRMFAIAAAVRAGEWLGSTGRPVRNVVNIGIGGSDLGPAMAVRALRPWAHPELTVRFVSNVDGAAVTAALADLDPAETLFVVCSKTFTTLETLANARVARRWLLDGLGAGDGAVASHFLAVSSAPDEASAFGIPRDHVLQMWDWVGGRYSLPSTIGLSLAIAVGPEAFTEMLDGFRDVDHHLRETPLARNLPVLLGLLGVWYRDLWGLQAHAVLPYAQDLDRFPAYLQQLEMESNGKSVTLEGAPVDVDTAPIVWGEPGTNGQHAFFQLLHQGTTVVPCDLIGFLHPTHDLDDLHRLLMANLLGQAEALAFGRTAAEVSAAGTAPALVAHKSFPGDRPSTVLLADRLTPRTLGRLIACYEHKVLTQGVVWGINSFDQWGVELGKALASRIADELAGTGDLATGPGAHDSSTAALIWRFRDAHEGDRDGHDVQEEG
jgi:glucose-6-phosphate isomerase